MKRKFIVTNSIQRNASQLTPWQSQNISSQINDNTKNINQEQQNYDLTQTKRFLPRVIRFHQKQSNKLQKLQYHLAKKQIIPDYKTFDTIRTAKQTSFNGFITKYKSQKKKKNKRYILMNQQLSFNSNYQFPNTLKFIHYNSLQHQQSQIDIPQSNNFNNKQINYLTKQVQFSRKRSLSNLIKSIGKDKYLKLKQPCRHSPWMLTNCLSQQRRSSQDKIGPQQAKRNIKLIQLNLGIRKRNLSNKRQDRK